MANLLALALFMVVSFLMGYFSKGISVTINHNNKQEEISTEYNESLVDELPNEVKQYYNEHKGVGM